MYASGVVLGIRCDDLVERVRLISYCADGFDYIWHKDSVFSQVAWSVGGINVFLDLAFFGIPCGAAGLQGHPLVGCGDGVCDSDVDRVVRCT